MNQHYLSVNVSLGEGDRCLVGQPCVTQGRHHIGVLIRQSETETVSLSAMDGGALESLSLACHEAAVRLKTAQAQADTSPECDDFGAAGIAPDSRRQP